MIYRKAFKDISILLDEFPAIALLGPRQAGKTTLAKNVGEELKKEVVYLDLERASDQRKLIDPELFFEANRDKLIVLDEVQTMPHLFAALRPEIDELRIPGRFLLTGSASPHLIKGVSESLAGRMAYVELTPVNFSEAADSNYTMSQHWFRGGFPPALTANSDEAFFRWADNFIQSYVENDLGALFGVTLLPALVRNFWRMMAANNGGILNIETFARSLGVTGPTVKRYLDLMEGAFLVRRLQPWFMNVTKRIVKSPKLYIRDTGILHVLTNVTSPAHLPGNLVVGGSWEGYVVEEIIRHLPTGIQAFYYRTQHGAEADLVLVKGIKPIACIEIKYSAAPVPSPGLYQCIADLETTNNWVIYSGKDTYENKEGLLFTSLETLLKDHIPGL